MHVSAVVKKHGSRIPRPAEDLRPDMLHNFWWGNDGARLLSWVSAEVKTCPKLGKDILP